MSMSMSVKSWLGVVTAVVVVACGSSDEASSESPAAACDSMCKSTGFSSSRLDAQPHETNCFCTGSGTVTAEACTNMCKSTAKPGSPFKSGGQTANACQCQ